MILFGSLVKNAEASNYFKGHLDAQVTVLYSTLDKLVHVAIKGGTSLTGKVPREI